MPMASSTRSRHLTESADFRRDVETDDGTLSVVSMVAALGEDVGRLPHVLRLLALNHAKTVGIENSGPMLDALFARAQGRRTNFEFMFRPARILMHDTTCTPALVDMAAMRDVVAEAGGDSRIVSPTLPVAVSIDHSLAVCGLLWWMALESPAPRPLRPTTLPR